VFFPVVCSLTSASTERHFHRFSHILATDIRSYRWAAQPLVNNRALLVFRRAAYSGRCSSRPTSRQSVALSADSVSITTHTYADDTQLYIEPVDGGSLVCGPALSLHQLSPALVPPQRNHLLLNGSKSEAIIIGTARRHARSLQPPQMNVAVSQSLKLLGVTFNRSLP